MINELGSPGQGYVMLDGGLMIYFLTGTGLRKQQNDSKAGYARKSETVETRKVQVYARLIIRVME